MAKSYAWKSRYSQVLKANFIQNHWKKLGTQGVFYDIDMTLHINREELDALYAIFREKTDYLALFDIVCL